MPDGSRARRMCNLYASMVGQEALRRTFRIDRDLIGNLPPLPAIFPDQHAPIVRSAPEGGRELVMARWGLPPPPRLGGLPVTNVRNTASPHWRAWLKPAHRALVPVTSFCEWADGSPRKVPTWFGLDESRPVFAFAGIWIDWSGTRGPKSNPVTGEHRLFGILTCAPNALVASVHPKAMPVLLTTREACDTWLSAPMEEALRLQRPAADEVLRIVARGCPSDDPSAEPEQPPAARGCGPGPDDLFGAGPRGVGA